MSVNSQYNSRGLETNPRRRLLLALAAGVALAPLRARADFFGALAGGFNAGMGGASGASFKAKHDAQLRRLATPETDAGSREAEAYFRANRLTMNSDRFSEAARRADAGEFRRATDGAVRAGLPRYLTFLQMANLGESLAPSLLRLDETWFYDELLADGRVYVPAKSATKVNYAGYCLDQSLPAPAGGARLRLLPLSAVTDEKTAKAMQGLAHVGASYAREISTFVRGPDSERMQSLVWALRDMQVGVQPKLDDAQRRLLAAADPEHFGSPNSLDEFGWRLGEAVGKDLRQSFGRLTDLSDMNSVKGRADEIARGSRGYAAPTGSPFTQMAPGVNAMSVGTRPLQGDVIIANDRPTPVLVNLRSYVAEAATDSQRILISDLANGLGRSDVAKNLIAAVEKDLAQLSAFAALDWFPKGIERIGVAPRSKVLAGLVSATPILGNVLSAAEAVSGYEWTEWFKTEKKPMGPGERVMAWAGTVPGLGAMAKVVGRDAIPGLLATAGRLADRAEGARELGQWATSDTAWALIDAASGSNPGQSEIALRESINQLTSSVRLAVAEVGRAAAA